MLCPAILIKISLQMLGWPEVAHLIDRFFPQLLPSHLFLSNISCFFISCIFSLFIFEKTASTSQVWSPYTKEKIKALERVQRCATKFNLKCDLTYPERLAKLGLLPIEFRREVLDFCFFFIWRKRHIDFDVLLYISFKSYKYDMRNTEATLAKGQLRTDVF